MPNKDAAAKKTLAKVKEEKVKLKSNGENVRKKGKEIMERKIKNATQKWFFSLEEKEQAFLETTYMIVIQISPDLTWENYLDRLTKTDKFNTGAKSIIKKVAGKW